MNRPKILTTRLFMTIFVPMLFLTDSGAVKGLFAIRALQHLSSRTDNSTIHLEDDAIP